MAEVKLNPNCKCPYNCPNHGNCASCRAKHSKDGSPTFCMMTQK